MMTEQERDWCKPNWHKMIYLLTRKHREQGGKPGLDRVLFIMREFARYAEPWGEDSERWIQGMIYVVEMWQHQQKESKEAV